MDRFELFSTPVHVFPVDGTDALNQALCATLCDEADRTPGLIRSNAGGWHSIPDLAQRPAPPFRGLMDMIVHHVQRAFDVTAAHQEVTPQRAYRFAVQGWAMVMRDGDYTILHDHAEAHWSVVYYADAGDADEDMHPDSGRLAFVDPRRGGASIPGIELFPTTFTVRPRTSTLVVFPGWLQHYVHPYRGQRPRVSISCNARMEPA